jgi:restriction endonuclease
VVEDIRADVGLVEFANQKVVNLHQKPMTNIRLMVRSAIRPTSTRNSCFTLQAGPDPAGIKPLTLFFISEFGPAHSRQAAGLVREVRSGHANGNA